MTLRLDNLATKVSSRSLFVRVGIPVIQSETAVVALLSLPHKIPLLEIQVLVFDEILGTSIAGLVLNPLA